MIFNTYMDLDSPFEPGKAVSPDRFKGRQENIKKILRYMNKARKGSVQHFFLTGKKGMGKTSLAEFVKDYVEINYGMIGIYVSNKNNNSLDSLISSIIQGFLNKIPKDTLKDKVKNIFSSIESIEVKGTKVSFNPNKKLIRDIRRDFPYYLNDLIKDLPKHNGVFLIIDDINGLSESKEFVNWYKAFADTIEVNKKDFDLPLYILFAAYPEKFDNLVSEEPSFGRIFHYDELDRLSDEEVIEFFIDTFLSVNMFLNNESLAFLSYFSQGIPLIMQEIGDSIYWSSDTNNLTEKDIIKGILRAVKEIESKQIRYVLKEISNNEFETLLLKIANENKPLFMESEFKNNLDWDEYDIWDDFLEKMLEVGILESSGSDKNRILEFSNQLYFTYFRLKSLNLKPDSAKLSS